MTVETIINELKALSSHRSKAFQQLLYPFKHPIILPDAEHPQTLSGPLLATMQYFNAIKEKAEDATKEYPDKSQNLQALPSITSMILAYLQLCTQTHQGPKIKVEELEPEFKDMDGTPIFNDYMQTLNTALHESILPTESEQITSDLEYLVKFIAQPRKQRNQFLEPIVELHKNRTLSFTRAYFKSKMELYTENDKGLKQELSAYGSEEEKIDAFINIFYLSDKYNNKLHAAKNKSNISYCRGMAEIHAVFTKSGQWPSVGKSIELLPNPLIHNPIFTNFNYWTNSNHLVSNAAKLAAFIEHGIITNSRSLIIIAADRSLTNHNPEDLGASKTGLFLNPNKLPNLHTIHKNLDRIKQLFPIASRSRRHAFALLYSALSPITLHANSMLESELKNAIVGGFLAKADLIGHAADSKKTEKTNQQFDQAISELKKITRNPMFWSNKDSYINQWIHANATESFAKDDKHIRDQLTALTEKCYNLAYRSFNHPVKRYFQTKLQPILVKLIQSDPLSIDEIFTPSNTDDYGAPITPDAEHSKYFEIVLSQLQQGLTKPKNNQKTALIYGKQVSSGPSFTFNDFYWSAHSFAERLRDKKTITIPGTTFTIPITIQTLIFIVCLGIPTALWMMGFIAIAPVIFLAAPLTTLLYGLLHFPNTDRLEYLGFLFGHGLGENRAKRITHVLSKELAKPKQSQHTAYCDSFKPSDPNEEATPPAP